MKLNKITTFLITTFFLAFLSYQPTHTDMSGGNYQIYTDSLSVISTQTTTGGKFELYQTAGEYYATTTSKGDYELRGGFQAQEQGILKVNLNKGSLDLGELSTSSVATSSINLNVFTDSETGYSVSTRKDGKLSDGSNNNIGPVVDGSVTAGSEEYGITTQGNDGQLSQDKKITNGLTIASKEGMALSRTTEIIFKAAIDSNTPSGNYSQKIYFDTTVNP
jgi:hypothetical protein